MYAEMKLSEYPKTELEILYEAVRIAEAKTNSIVCSKWMARIIQALDQKHNDTQRRD